MSRRLATSLIIAFAAGCGGPLDVGGVAGPRDAGIEDGSQPLEDPRIYELAKNMAGDWYGEFSFPPFVGARVKLTLTAEGSRSGTCTVVCNGCPDMGDKDGGASGSPGQGSQDPSRAISIKGCEYWLAKVDSETQGTGLFSASDIIDVPFTVNLTKETLDATWPILPFPFVRTAPWLMKDEGGAP